MLLTKLEQTSVWETIRDCPTPIALYGMGNGAEKILAVMQRYGRTADIIFASDAFVRGHSFLGQKVHTYSEVCEKCKDFTVVMAFGVHDEPMLRRIWEMNQNHPVLIPDVPVAGDRLFTTDFVAQHEAAFDFVYHNLADERSRQVYLDILNYKISGKAHYLYSSFDTKESVYTDILQLTGAETILDLGAYDGDTIREMLHATSGQYNKIIAVEADAKNFKKLEKSTMDMERMQRLHMGVWSERATLHFESKAGRNSRLSQNGTELQADSVDNLLQEPITLLKMDVEGAEYQALLGAENTIRNYKPKLYVCAYHRAEDLITLPQKIWELCPDYRLYFRHSPCIPAWECNFYGVASPASARGD